MAKWGPIPDRRPVLRSAAYFATPESHKELMDWINQHHGSERTAAMVGAMMAWNLACSIINGTSTCDGCSPMENLQLPQE